MHRVKRQILATFWVEYVHFGLEHLPSICKALDYIPSITKINKKLKFCNILTISPTTNKDNGNNSKSGNNRQKYSLPSLPHFWY